jgi:hypothetical protein
VASAAERPDVVLDGTYPVFERPEPIVQVGQVISRAAGTLFTRHIRVLLVGIQRTPWNQAIPA